MKKRKAAVIFISFVAILFVIITVLLCFKDIGMKKTVLKGKTHTVNEAMMTYYTYCVSREYIAQVKNNNGVRYLEGIGLDENISLRKQKSCYDDKTWFEYFYESAVKAAKEYLFYSEKAENTQGYNESVFIEKAEQEILSLKDISKKQGKDFSTYLKSEYGKNISEKDIKNALILKAEAEWYLENIEQISAFSDEEIEKYVALNADKFLMVDYRYFTVNSNNDFSFDEVKSVVNDLVNSIEKIGFDKAINNYTSSHKTSQPYTVKEYRYDDSTPVSDWLFDKSTAKNDVKIFETKASCTIVQKTSEIYRMDYPSANLKVAMIDTSKIDEKNSIIKDVENLNAELAKEKVLDNVTFEKIIKKHGFKTENKNYVLKGDFDYIGFDDWCFSNERKAGDFMTFGSNETFCFVMYSSIGDECWKVQARQWLREETEKELKEQIYKMY